MKRYMKTKHYSIFFFLDFPLFSSPRVLVVDIVLLLQINYGKSELSVKWFILNFYEKSDFYKLM